MEGPLAPGTRLPKHLLVPIQDAFPILTSRDNAEVFDQESHDRLQGDATGRQMELVKLGSIGMTVYMDVWSCHSATSFRVPMEGR